MLELFDFMLGSPMFFEIQFLFCGYVAQFLFVSVVQGLLPQVSAMSILQSVERFLSTGGASCKLNTSSFTVDVWLFTWLLLYCC